jgi:hypothetical protein
MLLLGELEIEDGLVGVTLTARLSNMDGVLSNLTYFQQNGRKRWHERKLGQP